MIPVPADMLVFDELDKASPDAKAFAKERLAHSARRRIIKLSNRRHFHVRNRGSFVWSRPGRKTSLTGLPSSRPGRCRFGGALGGRTQGHRVEGVIPQVIMGRPHLYQLRSLVGRHRLRRAETWKHGVASASKEASCAGVINSGTLPSLAFSNLPQRQCSTAVSYNCPNEPR